MQGPVPQVDSCIQKRFLSGDLHGEFHGISSGVEVKYKFVQFLEAMLPDEL